MAAAQFSDDAYNKQIGGDNAGTLCGNWFEERVLRACNGEGRTVPQRHVPRSGLLQDFTKMPSATRKGDNTFERVYGPKANMQPRASSKTIGDHEQGSGMKFVGPKELALKTARLDIAEAEVQEEDDFEEALRQARSFETTTGTTHIKPDITLAVKAEGKKSYHDELMYGPPAERERALHNQGLEVPTHAHYANMELVTHARMSLADPSMRNDLKVSACLGVSAFCKNDEFTKPCNKFTKGLDQDHELNIMFDSLKNTNAMRHLGGSVPKAGLFSAVPSLPALKGAIQDRIFEVWGQIGYVAMRQRLFDGSDHEGFITLSDIASVLRNELELSTDVVSEKALTVYLSQQATMDKHKVAVGAFMTSLRPNLSQKDKKQVLETIKSLKPVDGSVRLGDWLDRLTHSPELRKTVAIAFSGQDDIDSVADTRVTEQVFLELLSDLAPLMDISPLLV